MGNKNLKWRDCAWENAFVLVSRVGRVYEVKRLGVLKNKRFGRNARCSSTARG
jgi:hypothetical protein